MASQPMLRVSSHAISRYRERVEPVTFDVARQRLSSPIILKAAEIGCQSVKLPGGQRVVIENHTVITVRPRPVCSRHRHGRKSRGDMDFPEDSAMLSSDETNDLVQGDGRGHVRAALETTHALASAEQGGE